MLLCYLVRVSTTLLQRYFDTALLCYSATLLQHYFVTGLGLALLCYSATLLQRYFATALLCYGVGVSTTLLQRYFDTVLLYYRVGVSGMTEKAGWSAVPTPEPLNRALEVDPLCPPWGLALWPTGEGGPSSVKALHSEIWTVLPGR